MESTKKNNEMEADKPKRLPFRYKIVQLQNFMVSIALAPLTA